MATTPRQPLPTPPRPQIRPAQPTQSVPPKPNQPQQGGQVNIHGRGPQPNMAPPEEAPKGLADNTLAEMEAGKAILAKYDKQNNAEHEAGRKHLAHHQKHQKSPEDQKPPEEDDIETD